MQQIVTGKWAFITIHGSSTNKQGGRNQGLPKAAQDLRQRFEGSFKCFTVTRYPQNIKSNYIL